MMNGHVSVNRACALSHTIVRAPWSLEQLNYQDTLIVRTLSSLVQLNNLDTLIVRTPWKLGSIIRAP